MPRRKNYYRVLHVDPDAPVEIIRSSYRTLMRRMKKHPDLGGDQDPLLAWCGVRTMAGNV